MKILCSYSSIEYSCEHIPGIYIGSGEAHPVFSLSQKKLLGLLPKYFAGELTETDSYLVFLALLKSTELVQWSVPAIRTPLTASLIAANIQALADMVGKINAIHHPAFALPQFVISPDTRTLDNIKHWLAIWHNAYEDWLSGLADSTLREKLNRRERALERLIKNPAIAPIKYAGMLADWAATAGQFPTFKMQHPVTKLNTTLDAYWKEIITKCYKAESIISFPPKDVQELLDHCEETIEAGSIFSFHLFSTLREGKDRQNNFLGLDFSSSLNASNPGFKILAPEDSVEDAAIALLISTAPTSAPSRMDYPSAFAFLKAQMKWELAQKHTATTTTTAIESITGDTQNENQSL